MAHRVPVVTSLLIAANILCFVLELAHGDQIESFIQTWGLVPEEFTAGAKHDALFSPYWNVVSSMFLHAGLGHLVGNMWFLWVFGDNIECRFGHVPFLVLYLFTGVVAALAHVALYPHSPMPVVGASGAVSGILGAYFVLFPTVRIQTVVFLGFFLQVVRIPALFFLGLWFVLQLLGGVMASDDGAGGVAFAAHVGGGVAGFLVTAIGYGLGLLRER